MNQIHTSYKTSKRLKEFLGESMPMPFEDSMRPKHTMVWVDKVLIPIGNKWIKKDDIYSLQLHDLLSKPFLEAMCKAGACQTLEWVKELDANGIKHKCPTRVPIEDAGWMGKELYNAYFFDGGMEAVEKALTEMMGKK